MWRVHPRTREFQVVCEGTSNPYGIAWDTEGSAIVEACHWANDHLFHFVETGYYKRQAGAYPPYYIRKVGRSPTTVTRRPPTAGSPTSTATLIRSSIATGSTRATSTAAASTSTAEPRRLDVHRPSRARLPDRQRCLVHAGRRRRSGPTAASTSSTGTTAITAIRTPTATRRASTGSRADSIASVTKQSPRVGSSTWLRSRTTPCSRA